MSDAHGAAASTARRHEGDARRRRARARRLRRGTCVRPASRSSTTCSSSSASTAGSTSRRRRGRPRGRPHHTVEDVGIVLGTALREALGDKVGRAAVRVGLVPLDEALVEVALDLSGRPFLVYDDRPGRRVDRHLRPPAGRGVLAGVRRRRPGSRCTCGRCPGRNGHHVIEASFKGVARGASATRCGSRATALPSHEGHAVDL